MPMSLKVILTWQFCSVSGSKMPITEEMVLMTSMPFESAGRIYRIDFSLGGRVRFDAILFWKAYSYSLVGSLLKRSR